MLPSKLIDDESWWISRQVASVRKAFRSIRRRARAWQLRPGVDGESGIGHVITLGAGIFAGTAAMVTFLQQSGTTRRDFVVYIYLPAVLAPIVFLAGLLFLRINDGSTRRYYFDWPTRFCGACVLIVSIVVVGLVTRKGWSGTLPGQEPERPRTVGFSDAANYTWKDDVKAGLTTSGIVATIDIDDSLFPKGISDRLHFVFDLREPLAARWLIQKIDLDIQNIDKGTTTAAHLFINQDDAVDSDHANALYLEGIDKAKSYSVRMYLWSPKQYPQAQVDADAALIREGRGVRVSDRSNMKSTGPSR